MKHSIAQIALLVRDYDEAIDFYTKVMQFELIEDNQLTETKRWVRVQPRGGKGSSLLLAKAKDAEQMKAIGNQSGGRVFLFLHTDNFDRDYDHLNQHGVKIINGPRLEEYGKVMLFEDLYGNLWDLIERK